jgi:hypothetical protein
LETLQTDHRQVKESTDDAKKRGDLFKQFRTELTEVDPDRATAGAAL